MGRFSLLRLLGRENVESGSLAPLEQPFDNDAVHLATNLENFADDGREVLEFVAKKHETAVDR